jgi:hypothetical protein
MRLTYLLTAFLAAFTLASSSALGAIADSITVSMTKEPRSFTTTVKGERTETHNNGQLTVVANCREPNYEDPDFFDGIGATNIVKTIHRDPIMRDEWRACDDPFADSGTTWQESHTFNFSHFAGAIYTGGKFAPMGVYFLRPDNRLILGQTESKTLKIWTKRVWRTREVRRVVKIWDYQFDRYINICLNKGYKLYASQGHLYCNVTYTKTVRKRVRVPVKAKIRWTQNTYATEGVLTR